MSWAIGIDLGGTNIKAALIDSDSGERLQTLARPTRDGEWLDGSPRFAQTVQEIVAELEAAAGG